MPKFPVFTQAETAAFQQAINQYRTPGAYEPGRWSVSPLARRADIVGHFPERVMLRDIALPAHRCLWAPQC